MIVKCLDDFLPLRNVNDFVFKVLNKETDEELTWDIEDILDEINRDRSVIWFVYTKDTQGRAKPCLSKFLAGRILTVL
jgi:hypothetical protein